MKLNDYQKQIEQFAIYPGAGTGNKEAMIYTALGLAEEAGEYAGKIAKYIRDGVFETSLAAKELGDVLWQLARAAKELNMTLEDVAVMNIQKLLDRRDRNVIKGTGDVR
jgi:NTP pyrophosphatase (non-canonical NTP hydrolase)